VRRLLLGLALLALRWRLNLLTLAEEEARSLGLPVGTLCAPLIVAATLMTTAVVAISGSIGWIGLVIPHGCRLLPCAALAGAAFLLLVDTLARSLAAVEIPLGILTAFLGAPLFLVLLARGKRGWG
jgi:iron complex transport system permease protein